MMTSAHILRLSHPCSPNEFARGQANEKPVRRPVQACLWAGHMLLVHVAILLHKAGMQELQTSQASQQAKRNTGSCFAVCCVPVFSERAFLMTRGGGAGRAEKNRWQDLG